MPVKKEEANPVINTDIVRDLLDVFSPQELTGPRNFHGGTTGPVINVENNWANVTVVDRMPSVEVQPSRLGEGPPPSIRRRTTKKK